MENIAQTSAFTDISRFTALRANARRDGDKAMAPVAREFEALFIQQLLKAAREASPEGGLFNSRELKLYREMMDSQIALAMADQGGIGFAAALQDQFGVDPTVDGDTELTLPQPVYFPSQLRPRIPSEETTRIDPDATEVSTTVDPIGQATPEPNARTPNDFIHQLRPLAENAASKLGLSGDVLLAQAALETGWGRHVIAHPDGRSSNNFFAIKAGVGWNGDSVNVQTLEYIDGRPMKINASFRAYPDVGAAFDDYVTFLERQQRYAAALDHGGRSQNFVVGLQNAGYATDPRYAEKILEIKDQIRARSTIAAR